MVISYNPIKGVIFCVYVKKENLASTMSIPKTKRIGSLSTLSICFSYEYTHLKFFAWNAHFYNILIFVLKLIN